MGLITDFRLSDTLGTAPGAQLFETRGPTGQRAVALAYGQGRAAALEAALALRGAPPVPGVAALLAWDLEQGTLIYGAAEGVPLSLPLYRPDGPRWGGSGRAGLELLAKVAALLRDAAGPLEGAPHGAISPWRILLAPGGRVSLLGYGLPDLALNLADPTLDGSGEESLRNASPEQLRGEAPTAASDVYALALCAVELILGEPLFSGSRAEVQAQATRAEGPRLLIRRGAELAPETAALLRRCLQADPAARPSLASLAEEAARLAAVAEGSPLSTLLRAPGTATRGLGEPQVASRALSPPPRQSLAEEAISPASATPLWRPAERHPSARPPLPASPTRPAPPPVVPAPPVTQAPLSFATEPEGPAPLPSPVSLGAEGPQTPMGTPAAQAPLRRRAVVNYYKQLNPDRLFPLVVRVTAEGVPIHAPTDAEIGQARSAGTLLVSREAPRLRLVPRFPGCEVWPLAQEVDARQAVAEARFWIVPQIEADLREAAVVQIWQGERLLDEVPIPCRVVAQTVAKLSSLASASAAVGGVLLEALAPDLAERGSAPSVAVQLAASLLGTRGLILAAALALFSLGAWLWLRPWRGTPIDRLVSSAA